MDQQGYSYRGYCQNPGPSAHHPHPHHQHPHHPHLAQAHHLHPKPGGKSATDPTYRILLVAVGGYTEN
jgi:hypothetical protein